MTDPARAQTVDIDIAKHCAYSLPGVALTLGRQNWHCLRDTYETLASDVQVKGALSEAPMKWGGPSVGEEKRSAVGPTGLYFLWVPLAYGRGSDEMKPLVASAWQCQVYSRNATYALGNMAVCLLSVARVSSCALPVEGASDPGLLHPRAGCDSRGPAHSS